MPEDIFTEATSIDDECTAKGAVFAWTAILLADNRVEKCELTMLSHFARVSHYTRNFNKEGWLCRVFNEALNLFNELGLEALLLEIVKYLEHASTADKQVLLFSLMQLSGGDGDFTQEELDVLDKIVELLDIPRRDVLMTGLIFASRK